MNSKKWIDKYNRAHKTWLCECYKKPSMAKQVCDMYLRDCYENDGGYGFKIISYNNFTFTAGYKMIEEGEEYLKIFTHFNTYKIKL